MSVMLMVQLLASKLAFAGSKVSEPWLSVLYADVAPSLNPQVGKCVPEAVVDASA